MYLLKISNITNEENFLHHMKLWSSFYTYVSIVSVLQGFKNNAKCPLASYLNGVSITRI